jgi:hypothetical protein
MLANFAQVNGAAARSKRAVKENGRDANISHLTVQ